MIRAPHAEPLERLIDQFLRMPGVGRKSAERMAYHVLNAPRAEAIAMARAIRDVKDNMLHCSECGTLTERDPCRICSDPRRDRSQLCVIELPHDVAQIEKTGEYDGLYHVLMGHVSTLDGIGPKDLRIRELMARLENNEIREIILATNPNVDGEHTALHIREAIDKLGRSGLIVSEPARGIPLGTEIEFLDPAILGQALRSRRTL